MAKVVNKVVSAIAVTIELTADETAFLIDVMDSIGGDPNMSRRRHSDAIVRVLRDAGAKGMGDDDIAQPNYLCFKSKES